MKQFIREHSVQLVLIGLAFISILILSVSERKGKKDYVNNITDAIQSATMEAYTLGQIDAIEGRTCVKKINDTTWIYTNSPLGRGRKPVGDTIIHK
jgi:hypothetical protein